MKKILAIIALALLMCQCKSIKKITESVKGVEQSVADVKDGFLEIKNELVPVDSLTQNATGGAISGLMDSLTQSNLDTIGTRLSRALATNLNQMLDTLHVDTIGYNLLQGVTANLFSDSTKVKLDSLLSHIIRQAGVSLDSTLDISISKLLSDNTTKKLEDLVNGIFTKRNTDSLSEMLNNAVGNIKLDSLATQLALMLEDERVGNALDSLGVNFVRSTRDATNEEKWFSETGKQILWGIGALAAVIATIIFFLRRKLIREKQQSEISTALLMKKIEEMSQSSDIQDLKDAIKDEARSTGVNEYLEKMISKHQIKK